MSNWRYNVNSVESKWNGHRCQCVCAYPMRQWVQCDRSLFWLSHANTRLCLRPFHHSRSAQATERKRRHRIRTLSAPFARISRTWVCSCALQASKQQTQGCHSELASSFSSLFVAWTRALGLLWPYYLHHFIAYISFFATTASIQYTRPTHFQNVLVNKNKKNALQFFIALCL